MPPEPDLSGTEGGGSWLGTALIVLPDTQYYACAYHEIFHAQDTWIASRAAAADIGLVVHTGDVVDKDVDEQWDVASTSFRALDGTVPFLVTTGNHDLRADRRSRISEHFPVSRLRATPGFGGTMEADRVDNSYAFAELGGRTWIVIGLEFAPRNASVAWADALLTEHADKPAILFTHAYLYSTGQRYDRRYKSTQFRHPDWYHLTPEQGINDGEDLWQKLVTVHESVKIVLSGHVIPDGTARAVSIRPNGSRVHELLANYQTCGKCPCLEAEGGSGYLRILDFARDGESITVKTYSPYLDKSLRDPENEFVLDIR
jgi:hypothetical protein